MQPHAEMVHWFFAAGILFIGLCLFCEAIVGSEVWRMRAWRAYLWPGVAFALGVLLWPVMALYTNSAIHMYAHGSWAEVLMAGGRLRAGARPRPADVPLVAAHLAARVRRLRDRVHRPRAELVVLRPLGVPPPHARLDVRRDGGVPACADLAAELGRAALRVRADGRPRLGAAVLRPRRRSDLRAPVAGRRSAAPMRALLVTRSSHLRCRRSRRHTRRLRSATPELRCRAAARARHDPACSSTST